MHYVSVEYDPMKYVDNAQIGDYKPVLNGLLKWFTATLNQCQSGDFVIINGDFISMDPSTKDLLKRKCESGVNVILVVDRWEVSGYPPLSSKTEQLWSPKWGNSNACIADGPCFDSPQNNVYPYGCPDGSPGQKNNYCNNTNDVINTMKDCANFYLLDEAATILNTQSGNIS